MNKSLIVSLSGGMIGKTTVFNRMKRLTKKSNDIVYIPRIKRRDLFGSNISFRELFKMGAPGEHFQRIFLESYNNMLKNNEGKIIICDRSLIDILVLYETFKFEFYDRYFFSLKGFFEKDENQFITVIFRNEIYEDEDIQNKTIKLLESNDIPCFQHEYKMRKKFEMLQQEIDKAAFTILKVARILKRDDVRYGYESFNEIKETMKH